MNKVNERHREHTVYHSDKEIHIILIRLFIVPTNIFISKRKNSIGDALTSQPGEIVFNIMRYKRSKTVQRSGDFQSKQVNFVKVPIPALAVSSWSLSSSSSQATGIMSMYVLSARIGAALVHTDSSVCIKLRTFRGW